MRLRLYTITTSIFLFIVSAAASTFINQLPSCWQTSIEKRGPQCDSADLSCLCHFAANPTLLPTLLTCVRKTCDTNHYPEFLTAPLQAVQTACGGTQYKISDTAVSKAAGLAESAYSAAMGAEREGVGRATRTRIVKSCDSGMTVTSTGPPLSGSVGASESGIATILSPTTSAPASGSLASVENTTGAPTVVSGPSTTSSASSALRTSTSVARKSSGSGGRHLDVGQQGASVKKRAGSLLGLIAAVFVGFA